MLYPNNYWIPAYPNSNRPWIYKRCPFCNNEWANLPWDTKYCPGCGHYMLKNERITKDKDFVFCVECTKVYECKKCKREQIDGCNNGSAFYDRDPKSSGSEDK